MEQHAVGGIIWGQGSRSQSGQSSCHLKNVFTKHGHHKDQRLHARSKFVDRRTYKQTDRRKNLNNMSPLYDPRAYRSTPFDD